jgi:hypothetical protein
VSAYDTVPGGQEPEATRSRRPLVLTLVLLLVVGMAAGAAWWVLGDDAAPDVVDVAAPAPATASPASDTDVSVADGDVELVALPTATYEIFLARDPFEPVVPEDVQSGEGTAATPVSGSDDTSNTDDDNGATDPSDSADATDPDTAGSGCTRQGEVVCDGRVVSLVDVTTGSDGEAIAAVQVDTTIYEVVPGQTFAGSFQLRAIDGQCVSLLHGDDGFQLCTGDRVLK